MGSARNGAKRRHGRGTVQPGAILETFRTGLRCVQTRLARAPVRGYQDGMTQLPIDPVENLAALIRCPSVTPDEGGALSSLQAMLEPLGFAVERPVFRQAGTPDVENLLAVRGASGPHLAFAGHTDVVPPGDETAWRHSPFSAAIENGEIYGRGAVDMKGGIACFVAAIARLAARDALPEGRVSLLITGDEEGPALNGTVKLLDHAIGRGHRFDACVVGEPTSAKAMGDMVKVGRRGSLSGTVTVFGRQGHAAYPDRAANPMRMLPAVMEALQREPLDAGTESFQPSNLEITTVDTGNRAGNVIPAKVGLAFNIRHNDLWNAQTLEAELRRRLETVVPAHWAARGVTVELTCLPTNADAFLTPEGDLTRSIGEAIHAVTGRRPEMSTTGGTSDARFIKNACPVVEFGLVGSTMHMVDERVPLEDLEVLTRIYEDFVIRWFASANGASA